jgi:hypothetical protein
MHVFKPSRVHRLPPDVGVLILVRSVYSFVVGLIMADEHSPPVSPDIASPGPESETPSSQTSISTLATHEAAAERNAKKKADDRARMKVNRSAAKVLKLPQSSNVSVMLESLEAAKVKRDTAKKEAKLETKKVTAARKRVDRIKAKAKILSNNDLYEVYLMRMKEDEKKKSRE